jgi:VanZ family protein
LVKEKGPLLGPLWFLYAVAKNKGVLLQKIITRLNRFLLPAIAWFILCTFLLTLPGNSFPQQSWTDYIPQFDKWVHIGLFSIMCVLFCWGFYKAGKFPLKKFFLYSLLFCVVYGIVMEFVQRNFIPNRSFDTGDIIADTIGAAIGYWFALKRYKKN